MHCTIPKNFKVRICYTSTKLGTKFKDVVEKPHQYKVVYDATCPEPDCGRLHW